jgi:hypothetical protein
MLRCGLTYGDSSRASTTCDRMKQEFPARARKPGKLKGIAGHLHVLSALSKRAWAA